MTIRTGVVAHIFHRGKILLILRDDLPRINYRNSWDSVTETLEKGEGFEDGMRRGLHEEIGVVPESLQMLGVTKAGHGFFFAVLTDIERRAVRLGSEGQGIDFFALRGLLSKRLGGAVKFHIAAHPKAFIKMSQGLTPDPAELGLNVLIPAG